MRLFGKLKHWFRSKLLKEVELAPAHWSVRDSVAFAGHDINSIRGFPMVKQAKAVLVVKPKRKRKRKAKAEAEAPVVAPTDDEAKEAEPRSEPTTRAKAEVEAEPITKPVPHAHEVSPPTRVSFMARPRLPGRSMPRITPKRPKLRR